MPILTYECDDCHLVLNTFDMPPVLGSDGIICYNCAASTDGIEEENK